MRAVRVILATLVLSLGGVLAGCDTLENFTLWDTKKKLPGERKAVFPEGVPGVTQGIPPELVKGYQEPQQPVDPATAAAQATAEKAEPKPPPKPKPKPRVAARPKPQQTQPQQTQPQQQPAPQAQAPWPAQQPQQQPAPQAQAPWPGQQPQQQPAWPAAR